MQHHPTNSDRSRSPITVRLRRWWDILCRRAEPAPGEELEPGVVIPPLHHAQRLPQMLAAHGLTAPVLASVDAATQQYMQQNCARCPHGNTCDLHRSVGAAEALAPRYCRNIELIQMLQDRHVGAEILNIPRHVRFRRRVIAPVLPRAVLDC